MFQIPHELPRRYYSSSELWIGVTKRTFWGLFTDCFCWFIATSSANASEDSRRARSALSTSTCPLGGAATLTIELGRLHADLPIVPGRATNCDTERPAATGTEALWADLVNMAANCWADECS